MHSSHAKPGTRCGVGPFCGMLRLARQTFPPHHSAALTCASAPPLSTAALIWSPAASGSEQMRSVSFFTSAVGGTVFPTAAARGQGGPGSGTRAKQGAINAALLTCNVVRRQPMKESLDANPIQLTVLSGVGGPVPLQALWLPLLHAVGQEGGASSSWLRSCTPVPTSAAGLGTTRTRQATTASP